MGRFPFDVPNGWYLLAESDALPSGSVGRYHYVGRELVAFRGEDGRVGVFDAHCPHLGAHLGVGGRVEGNALRCPFHAWQFDATGRCVAIPYARRIPARARLRAYPCVEKNGMIFFWYHAEDAAPFFELPDLPEWSDDEFTPSWVWHEWTVRTHPQEMAENAVDWAHFPNIHRMEMRLDLCHAFEGPALFWSLGAHKEVSTLAGTEDDLSLEGENWGLGYSVVRQRARFRTVVVTGLTPIDGETTHVRLGVIARHTGLSASELRTTLDAYVAEHAVVATEDFHIWENKIYRPQPLLCDGDGAIVEFRSWATQFYGTGSGAAGGDSAQ